jgi:hypothetical protein
MPGVSNRLKLSAGVMFIMRLVYLDVSNADNCSIIDRESNITKKQSKMSVIILRSFYSIFNYIIKIFYIGRH